MSNTSHERIFEFRLDLHSGVPVYRQIIDQVLGGIAAGTLTPGHQLPTVRQVAVDLSINPNTVVRAYREMEIRGVLETQQGTGTFISQQKVKLDDIERQRQLTQLVSEFVSRAGAAGFTIEELQEQLQDRSTNDRSINARSIDVAKRGDEFMRSDFVAFKASPVGVALLVGSLAAGAALSALLQNPVPMFVLALVGLYLLFAIRMADQWEKVAVLRFGKYIGLRGPGMFTIIPVVDSLSRYVDQRVRVANVSAESTLTRDTVPVNVDAIVFWMVWNAEKSILEVQDFTQAIEFSAQTALRESIGRHELHQMVAERELMGKELQRILDEKTTGWGITVQSVEIRDVQIPPALQDAMSREAQAERERRARIILGTAETEIAEKFGQAALTYQHNPVALHLRAMNMLYEAIKEKGSMVIVPSSAVETMGLGGMLGVASIGGAKPQ